MAKGKKFGLGIVIGAAVGVVAGLLTAPKSGKETRQDIKNKAHEVKGSAERKLKDAHKELARLSEDLAKKAQVLKGQAKTELNDLGTKAEELKAQIKAAITSIKSGDDDSDDATIDQLLKDFEALRSKIATKIKNLRTK